MRTHLLREAKKSTKKSPPNKWFHFRCGLPHSDFFRYRPWGQALLPEVFEFLTVSRGNPLDLTFSELARRGDRQAASFPLASFGNKNNLIPVNLLDKARENLYFCGRCLVLRQGTAIHVYVGVGV